MARLLSSYLAYARGERSSLSPWGLLRVFGGILSPFIRLRNSLYDRGVFESKDSALPVISVGNLCHGGTNKTPMVEALTRRLQEAGLSVGIVSRGYGAKAGVPLWVGSDEKSMVRSVAGDEPLMLTRRLPDAKVVIAPERHSGIALLYGLGADVVVADDAFQHRRMGRDLDIVLIDATCPLGNGSLLPAGILREPPESLRRADIIIITKSEQVTPESLQATIELISCYRPRGDIFTARTRYDEWLVLEGGEWREHRGGIPGGKLMAFSAIANPDSFRRSLDALGIVVTEHRIFRDHHRFTWRDVDNMERRANQSGAEAFICTEKDMHNLPDSVSLIKPLYVPRISIEIDDSARFWELATKYLRPRMVVTSNGHGEDAIGALLASDLKKRWPGADVSAFCLVGTGDEYLKRGVPVISPPSVLPSGGVVKYSLRALLTDLRSGLRQDIRRQIAVWRERAGKFLTPLCVGDGYLLGHTLWGQGKTPLLLATAKSVRLNGHWLLERILLRRRCRRVWTRDEDTAKVLERSGIEAVFAGSPIMDLALGNEEAESPWDEAETPRILLLPGSRPRSYRDVGLLFDAMKRITADRACQFVMVLAPTIDRERLLAAAGDGAAASGVRFFDGPVAVAARKADILIGFGGTANQVAAGLGVPVISVHERGKLAQKKLLGDALLLVQASGQALADAALALLDDHARHRAMSEAGIKRMGGPGAVSAVAGYAAEELGWNARMKFYDTLAAHFGLAHCEKEETEVEPKWVMSRKTQAKLMRVVRIMGRMRTTESKYAE